MKEVQRAFIQYRNETYILLSDLLNASSMHLKQENTMLHWKLHLDEIQ